MVIGTGDLSELALGWATYNGDHMSMYAVNASVPKTLVRHLVLPLRTGESLKILDAIHDQLPAGTPVSLMRQYTPMGGLPAPFDRRVTDEEYDAVLSWMYLNELEGFTQEAEAADTGFIPDFLAGEQ